MVTTTSFELSRYHDLFLHAKKFSRENEIVTRGIEVLIPITSYFYFFACLFAVSVNIGNVTFLAISDILLAKRKSRFNSCHDRI